jgi:signal transduction histidine kinase
MGIGLHESLQYVRELGGRIEPRSTAGHGTVMSVWLPLLDAGLDLPPLQLNQAT